VRRFFLAAVVSAGLLLTLSLISAGSVGEGLAPSSSIRSQWALIAATPYRQVKADLGLPVRLRFPSLGINAAVICVGLASGGAVGVPPTVMPTFPDRNSGHDRGELGAPSSQVTRFTAEQQPRSIILQSCGPEIYRKCEIATEIQFHLLFELAVSTARISPQRSFLLLRKGQA
jgi:hypothetical protein